MDNDQQWARSRPQRAVDRYHWCPAGVDGVDDLGAVDALEVDRGDAEVGVSELALDDDQPDTFARRASRSASVSASASWMRSPARQSTTISPRIRNPCGVVPARRMTATISSTVGGSAG